MSDAMSQNGRGRMANDIIIYQVYNYIPRIGAGGGPVPGR